MKNIIELPGGEKYDCTPLYPGTVVERGVIMEARDGTRLAMDIYRPARGGRPVPEALPAVLWRTPYDRAKRHVDTARFLARRGYACVIQDVRGRYGSEGEFYPFANEGPDGYDAVEWIARQGWCDGRVGTRGPSYDAAVQSALACLDPPHLAAMVPMFGPSSFFHSALRQNGALEMRFFTYAFRMAASSREAAADPLVAAALSEAARNVWEWVESFPLRAGESPLSLVPSYERWAVDISTRAAYDGYWTVPGYGPLASLDRHADVPTLYIGGWYDSYTRGTMENFSAFHGRGKAPVQVLVGPWFHDFLARPESGDLSFAPEVGPGNLEVVTLRWFDQWLKGRDNGLERREPVTYFLMGGGTGPREGSRLISRGGRWEKARAWPPAGTRPVPFYLRAGGRLSADGPVAGEAGSTAYTYDPADPVPTIGGNYSVIPLPAGGFDQRADDRFAFTRGTLPLAARSDVLSFAGEPLAADLVVAGPVHATLWVATDGPDTDFTVKLVDLHPPAPGYPHGAAVNITDSIMRLRFRDGFEREKPAVPGAVYRLDFELYPTAALFARGHRLRVDVSSSNFPRFDRNPNTGGPLGVDRRRRAAVNTLYHASGKASCLTLAVGTAEPGG